MMIMLAGIGGFFGASLRYILSKRINSIHNSFYPIETFIINISGAILLGYFSNINLSISLYYLIANGFLASFTTFSTFMREGYELFSLKFSHSLMYILITIIIGIIGYYLGYIIAI